VKSVFCVDSGIKEMDFLKAVFAKAGVAEASAATRGTADPTGITRVDIPLPGKKLAFMLYNVFTPEECQSLIAETESRGYRPALINVGGGKQLLMTQYRNNDRYATLYSSGLSVKMYYR